MEKFTWLRWKERKDLIIDHCCLDSGKWSHVPAPPSFPTTIRVEIQEFPVTPLNRKWINNPAKPQKSVPTTYTTKSLHILRAIYNLKFYCFYSSRKWSSRWACTKLIEVGTEKFVPWQNTLAIRFDKFTSASWFQDWTCQWAKKNSFRLRLLSKLALFQDKSRPIMYILKQHFHFQFQLCFPFHKLE